MKHSSTPCWRRQQGVDGMMWGEIRLATDFGAGIVFNAPDDFRT